MAKLKRQEPSAFKKAIRLIDELFEHPRTGTGKPELLSGDRAGQWSRRITKKHRLVYEISVSRQVLPRFRVKAIFILKKFQKFNKKLL